MKPFTQGYFDSLCGVYSIVNAYSVITGVSVDECQTMFNEIVKYLPKKTITDGVAHSDVKRIARRFLRSILCETDKKSIGTLDGWWDYSREFLSHPGRAVIASVVDPKVWVRPVGHLTVIRRMTERTIYLHDSNKRTTWRRGECTVAPDSDKSMVVIYPAQCWYLEKA